jgi:peroxiredoxin
MARTPSNMIPLGTLLPNHHLLDTLSNTTMSVEDIANDKPLLVMFICNHCPFVAHLHQGIQALYNDYKSKGIQFLAVSANDITNYPEDSPALMNVLFQKLKLNFPYLYDESQQFAKALDAACTPDFYLFNARKELVYRGRFDESRPGNGVPVTGDDLRQALDLLLQNLPMPIQQRPSLGCNIKWK